MFLRWGAACSRAHLISACRVALACGLSLALSLPLSLPYGLALAASDSVFVRGAGATNGAAPTSPTLGGQATPGLRLQRSPPRNQAQSKRQRCKHRQSKIPQCPRQQAQ